VGLRYPVHSSYLPPLVLFRILLAMLSTVVGLWDPPGHLLSAFPA
jgi:hypothetical protein